MPSSYMNRRRLQHCNCNKSISHAVFSLGHLSYTVLFVASVILSVVMPQTGICLVASQGQTLANQCNVTSASACTQETFLNGSGCCQACSPCPQGMRTTTECSSTQDTHCESICTDPNTFYSELDDDCIIDCSMCVEQGGECLAELNRCKCNPNLCYLDEFCSIPCIKVTVTSGPPVVQDPGNPSTLPPWGIGLIAAGAVVGIIAFSAGFLFIGVCTSKKRTDRDPENEGSDNSSSVLMNSGKTSGTNSTYLGGYPNQSLIELLRQSNTPINSSLSSFKSSPRSARSSPLPKTEPARTDIPCLHKKSSIQHQFSHHSKYLSSRTFQVDVDNHLKSAVV